MLRDKNLIPLSHQHQRALALCVRIDRASPIANADLHSWQAEIAQLFRTEISIHFTAEEGVLFREASKFPELTVLVNELLSEHAELRLQFGAAESGEMSTEDLLAFAKMLSTHIRKEERQLFEQMQALMDSQQLAALGVELAEALKNAIQVCAIPSAPRISS